MIDNPCMDAEMSESDNGSSNDEATKVLSGDQATLNQDMLKAKEQEACLIIIRGTPQGHRYFLTQENMIIGREVTVEISVVDQGISRKHAQISKIADKVFITDLGSANGTLVNDKKLPPKEPKELQKEDMIKLGNSILKFLPAGELETLFYGNLGLAANTDPLTKTYNKRYLLEALDAEFKRAKALHSDFTLLFLDLDHFKKVNDTYGHDAGDFVLREFAQLIRTQLRTKDIFARYGGEEFIILMGNTNATDAAEVAEKMRASVELHPFIYEGKRIPVTSSMGLAELETGIESATTLLKRADQALYEAKKTGRNRLVIANG